MNRFFLSVVLCFVCVVAQAQHNAKTGKWNRVSNTHDPEYIEAATAAIREVMEQNFQACSTENLKAVMATMTSDCPDRAQFMRECQKMFDDTDVYIRLVDCRWLTSWEDSNGLWAAVQITQWTMPKDDDVEYTEYRHRSGLLPEWELCEYQLFARVERGQWKAHVINGNMSEALWPEETAPPARPVAEVTKPTSAKGKRKATGKAVQPVQTEDSCPDGTCPNQWPATPVVRPRMTMK